MSHVNGDNRCVCVYIHVYIYVHICVCTIHAMGVIVQVKQCVHINEKNEYVQGIRGDYKYVSITINNYQVHVYSLMVQFLIVHIQNP